MSRPVLLTVVIPVLNQVRYVRECLESLVGQRGTDVEILIRDAGSTDGTLQILEEYRAVIADIYVGSDHGQSDAIDAGFRRARGEYLTWLNADDVLLPGAIDSIRRELAVVERPQWLVGDTVLIDENGLTTRASRAGRCIGGRHLRQAFTYSPSSVFSKRIYEEVGGLDLAFHYCMDTELWFRFLQEGYRYRRSHRHWWGFREHDGSKTTAHKFSVEVHDPYAPSQYRQQAEQQELYLRHGVYSGSYVEQASGIYARMLRCFELSLPLQYVDSRMNRGRHWSQFRRFAVGP